MDETEFWEIVDSTREAADGDPEDHADLLVERLAQLDPDAVLDFARHFETRFIRAFRWDLWGAADIMLGGADDESFDYFRCWLIGQGRHVFEGALHSPDDLAFLVAEFDPEIDGDARGSRLRGGRGVRAAHRGPAARPRTAPARTRPRATRSTSTTSRRWPPASPSSGRASADPAASLRPRRAPRVEDDVMRIAVTGASGLIGSALTESLTASSHEVVRLVRHEPRSADEARWDPAAGTVDAGRPRRLPGDRPPRRSADRQPPVDRRAQEGTARQPRARHRGDRPRGRRDGHAARGAALRQRDRLLRRHRRLLGRRGQSRGRRGSSPTWSGTGRPPRSRRAPPASVRCTPVPAWWWPPRAAPGPGSSRCSRPVSAAGSGTAASSGASSHCTTRSPHSATLLDTPPLSGPVNLTAPEPLTNRRDHRGDGPRPPPADTGDRTRRRRCASCSASSRRTSSAASGCGPRCCSSRGFAFAFPKIEEAVRAAID